MSDLPVPPGGRRITTEGHVFDILDLTPGDMLDLFSAAGASSGNSGFVVYASQICRVRAIDGVPVPFPRSVEAIKALGNRIGHAALNVLMSEGDGDVADVTDAAKNSPGTLSSGIASTS